MKQIYFGHPISVYNTPKESELIQAIQKQFPGWHIENPNQPHHSEGYQTWKKNFGNGMSYYYQEVLPKMHAGVFLPFLDRMWGAGVFNEAEFLFNQDKPIYEINYLGEISPVTLDEAKKLSIEETRKRVYK